VDEDAEPQRNCPAIDAEGRLYFVVADKLIAFDDDNGKLKQAWSYDGSGGRMVSSPVIGPDGKIRVHSSDGYLHTISSDGKRASEPVQMSEPLGWATPLVDSENTTWICGCHGGLYRVDANGRAETTPYFRGMQRLDCSGLIHDGILYVGAENGCVYSIPLGESRGANQWDHLASAGCTGWFINSAIALAAGPTLIVASRDDHLHGFQLDGKKLWSVGVEGQMLGSPVVDSDGSVYVGLSIIEGRDKPRGGLARIDGVSHQVRWRYETDSPVESTPVIGDDGNIYFGDNDGWVYAVNSDGKQLWTHQVPAGVRSPGALIGKGRVVFGLENGQYVALNCESNSLRTGAWAKYLGNAAQSGATNK